MPQYRWEKIGKLDLSYTKESLNVWFEVFDYAAAFWPFNIFLKINIQESVS